MTLQFGLTLVVTSAILQGAVASPLDIGSLYDPSQQPRHYSHYRVTIVLRYPPSLPFSADVSDEADLARKTSLIFEALQRFAEHAQWRRGEQRREPVAQRRSHTKHSLRVSAVDLQLAVRTTDATLCFAPCHWLLQSTFYFIFFI